MKAWRHESDWFIKITRQPEVVAVSGFTSNVAFSRESGKDAKEVVFIKKLVS
jgi:hypothetical protein